MHAGFYEYLALIGVLFSIIIVGCWFLADDNGEIVFTIPMPDFITRRFK